MKKLLTVLALGVAMGGGFVSAKDASDKPLKGKITSIKPDASTSTSTDIVIVHGKNKDEVTVVVPADAKVTVTLDGAEAKLTDLKEGETVVVTPATGTPTSIAATTHKKKEANAPAAK